MAAADLSSVVPPSAVPIPAPKPKQKAANTSTLGTLENDLVSQTKQAEQDTTKYQDSVAKITQDFHDQLGELKSQAPKVPENKPFEAPEQVNPISAFGSSAGLLAGIASLFTRAPLTASLNALSSWMKAINEGNSTNYQRAFDEFKTNNDYAFKILDAENKQYDRLIDLAKTDYDGALNGIKTLSAMTNDKAVQTAAAMKGIEGVESLNIERARLNNEIQSNAAKMIPAQIFDTSLKEFQQQYGRKPTADEMGKLWQKTQQNTTLSNMSPETLQRMAQMYVAGDKAAATGAFGYGPAGQANRDLFQNYITQEMINQGKTPQQIALAQAEYVGLQSKERALGTQEARVGTAVDELTRVTPLALQASQEVARGNLVPWTQVQQAIQHGTSDPKLARLNAATQTVINVYARATNPLGVARVSDKDHARDLLAASDGPQAFAATIDQLNKEANAAGLSPSDVRQTTHDEFLGTPVRPPTKNDVYLPLNADDYDALPKGTKYRKPDDPADSWRVKP